MDRERLEALGVSEEGQNEILHAFSALRAESALLRAGATSPALALPLLDLHGDLDAQIEGLKSQKEYSLLFAAPNIRGVSPSERADAEFGIDRETFKAHKNDPDWINRNWAQIADALEQGRITE